MQLHIPQEQLAGAEMSEFSVIHREKSERMCTYMYLFDVCRQSSGKTSFGNFLGLPANYQTSNPINGNAAQLPGLPASYR
jgi:hypothetical protein